MEQMVAQLAKQVDGLSEGLGMPDSGMYGQSTSALIGMPGATPKDEGVMLQNLDTGEIKHFRNERLAWDWIEGSGALVGDEESGVYPADPTQDSSDKSRWSFVTAPTAQRATPGKLKDRVMQVPNEGIYDLQDQKWLVVFDENLIKVGDGLYDPNTDTYRVKPSKKYNHIKSVGGGLYDLSLGAWAKEPPEGFDHLKSVAGGLWDVNKNDWEVKPAGDYSHIKAVQGGLKNIRDNVWVVEPKPEDRKAYSPVRMVNPNPPMNPDSDTRLLREYTLDANTDQETLDFLSDNGYQAVPKTEVGESLPAGAYETPGRRDTGKATVTFYNGGIQMIDDAIRILSEDKTKGGPLGSVRRFAQKFGRILDDVSPWDFTGGFSVKDYAINMLEDEARRGNTEAQEILEEGFFSPDIGYIELIENSLAAIVARMNNPKDRLLKDQYELARKDTKITGLRSTQDVIDKYTKLRQRMVKLRDEESERSLEGGSDDATEAEIQQLEAELGISSG